MSDWVISGLFGRTAMTSMLDAQKPFVRGKQRPPFERIALLLQGGGALGSYQAGVYEALTEVS
jgi:hypothetical protein